MQEHAREGGPTHWDLMLQIGEVLRTYRLDSPPVELIDHPCTATRIHDHSLRFLSYQGSVNKGLGNVRIVDSGKYKLLEDTTESIRLDFDGHILTRRFRLSHKEGDVWEFERTSE